MREGGETHGVKAASAVVDPEQNGGSRGGIQKPPPTGEEIKYIPKQAESRARYQRDTYT